MRWSRRSIFWCAVVVFAALVVWWTVYIPYAPDRLYRAIPAHATVVSAHHDLAGRWDALTGNPVTASFFGAMGLDAAELKTLGADADFRRWLEKLASDEMVVAYVPSLGNTRAPAWVFASWLGGRSQRLRWWLQWARAPGLQKIASNSGWPVWVAHSDLLQNNEVITLALVEGMLVGCIAPSLSSMDDVLRAVNGNYVSLASEGRGMQFMRKTRSDPDCGWAKFGRSADADPASWLHYRFSNVQTASIEGAISLPFAWTAEPGNPDASGMEGLTRVLGDLPLAYIVFDKSLGESWIKNGLLPDVWVNTAMDLAERVGGAVALCLLGGDFRGRFKGVRLPTLMLGFSLDNPTSTVQSLNTRLDQLNAVFRWGLVPQELRIGPYRVVSVESTSDNLYASLAVSERIAYAAGEDWMLLSSNLEGLTNLLQTAQRRARTADSPLSRGLVQREMNRAPIYGWMNLDEGGKAVRMAITAWALKLSFEDPFGSQATRQRLNEAKAWIEAVAPLAALRFWVRPVADATEIQFKAGRPEPVLE